MAKYICNRDCFHNNRFHQHDREYEFPDGVGVPRHFTPIDAGAPPPLASPAAKQPDTMSAMLPPRTVSTSDVQTLSELNAAQQPQATKTVATPPSPAAPAPRRPGRPRKAPPNLKDT
jgi:hypothetical protein